MDLIKHIKALNSKAEWPMLKCKIRDLLDYHEGALGAIDGKLVKPGALVADADDKMVNNYKVQSVKFKAKSTCNYYKQPGHWIRQCQKWIVDGRPSKDATLKKEKNKTMKTELLTTYGEIFSTEVKENSWCIDNGAMKHVTNRSDYFVSYEAFTQPQCIRSAGKQFLNSYGKGTVRLSSTVDAKK
ncbi:hypothetical protein GWI33_018970 [Rhynchophorus ferrugineus]|uniref:Retrovirus-related Pol polyprotein from transposon TNT 1-94-like beta-barrel domain-containing protein n=1 Tax=Rhynchophorus ferrugineus TaxID=354439 RepID=A0A834HUS0_RHYFE|nr:hypothetical protein GWI33_018970 [Rhynchophorus ferrugineus]